MVGDTPDMQQRLRALLPARWFSDCAPNLDGVLRSLATPWSWLHEITRFVVRQARLSTASGEWLDTFASDFFGAAVRRWLQEPDPHYRARIQYLLFRPTATRAA